VIDQKKNSLTLKKTRTKKKKKKKLKKQNWLSTLNLLLTQKKMLTTSLELLIFLLGFVSCQLVCTPLAVNPPFGSNIRTEVVALKTHAIVAIPLTQPW
jgi:hypothetical protein